MADFTSNALLKSAVVTQWDIIFDTLLSYPTQSKKLIVLDEFQYIGRSNPAFPSVFQKIWDTKLKDKNVMVILCGSLISLMESQTLAYSSPLYGRRTGQIKMAQIPFAYYQEFFPEKTHKELIEFYSITGGVPKYIELFEDSSDIFTAIEKNVLSKQSFLYEEPVFLLQPGADGLHLNLFTLHARLMNGNEIGYYIIDARAMPAGYLRKWYWWR